MKILFQLVHPSKYQLHNVTINKLISNNHEVDVLIQNKDVLEDLVKNEEWNYYNLFPRGRKISFLPKTVSNVLILIISIFRQLNFVRNRNYDLLVGGELGIVGKLRSIPSIYVTDTDMHNVPHQHQGCYFADYIFCPEVCDMGMYNYKKIPYDGFKALCHLHPNYFRPDKNKLPKYLRGKRFFLIRTCLHNSNHDTNETKGISDRDLFYLTNFLEKHGDIVLTTERLLPSYFSKYHFVEQKGDISHFIYFADMFIGDSITMSAEACILGTLSVEYDTWWSKFKQMEYLLETNLLIGVEPGNVLALLQVIKDIIDNFDSYQKKANIGLKRLLSEKMDVSLFQYWLINNFPDSITEINIDREIKKNFYNIID